MNFRTLKQNLSQSFDKIKAATTNGEMPDKRDIEQFARLTRLFHAQAQEGWAGEVEDFCLLVEQLHLAARKKQFEEVVMLVDSLEDAQNYCHRLFQA